jgi:BMFP domain-containing protein YqiC
MDLLLKENFDLKREIVFERKKYVDLQQAYEDLRHSLNEGKDDNSPEKRQPRNSVPAHMERLSAKSSAS